MIPSEMAARIRLLTESGLFDNGVEGVSSIRELQAKLPQLLPGQPFTATIQRMLPDGTFQAIVAGRNLTLALSQSAQPGDTLELVATQTAGNTVFARTAADATVNTQVSGQTNLSNTARLISNLLTGQNAPGSTPLANGTPLVATPPQDATAARQLLAPALQQALRESGLFYEAHQEKWLAGKVQTADLLREPQGKLGAQLLADLAQSQIQSAALAAQQATAPGAAAQQPAGLLAELARTLDAAMRPLQGNAPDLPDTGADPAKQPAPNGQQPAQSATGNATAGKDALAATARELVQLAKNPAAGDPDGTDPAQSAARQTAARDSADAAAQQQTTATTARQPIPERLAPLVHQQLESLATQNYLMHGLAWPGQRFEWEIEDQGHRAHGGDGELQEWNTTLRVTMPNMGGVEARLVLTPKGVALRLIAEYDDAVLRLNQSREELEQALEAANVPLTGFIAEKLKAAPTTTADPAGEPAHG